MYDAASLEAPQRAPPRLGGFRVEALAKRATHVFGKLPCASFNLIEGQGVEGDAHCGATDQHLGLGKANPPPNLRQLHLFTAELIDDLRERGFAVSPGAMGENVVTRGVDLVSLPLGCELVFPSGATARLTGVRTPCRLLDRLGKGLMTALRGDGAWGENPIAGVMAVITRGGVVRVADEVGIVAPPTLHVRLPAL